MKQLLAMASHEAIGYLATLKFAWNSLAQNVRTPNAIANQTLSITN